MPPDTPAGNNSSAKGVFTVILNFYKPELCSIIPAFLPRDLFFICIPFEKMQPADTLI